MLLTAFVASLVAFFAARWLVKSEDPKGQILVGIAVFIVLNLAGRSVVKPYVAEQKRMENPLYRAVKANDPELYAKWKELDADRRLEMLAQTKRDTAALLAKYAPRASDESLREFLQVSVEQLDAIRATSGSSAAGALFGGNVDLEKLGAQLSEEKVNRMTSSLAAIVESGAKGEPREIDTARAQDLVARVSQRLVASGALPMNDAGGIAAANQVAMAGTISDFYHGILALPPQDAALVARYLLSRAKV